MGKGAPKAGGGKEERGWHLENLLRAKAEVLREQRAEHFGIVLSTDLIISECGRF